VGIVLDLIIRNTVGVPAIFRPGVGTYEFWLKIGIVLLGARFLLGDLAKLGGFSFAYSPEAQNVAVAVKNTRNALIRVVVLIYALYWSSRGGVAVERGWRPRSAFLWRTNQSSTPSGRTRTTSSLAAEGRPATCSDRSYWSLQNHGTAV